MICFKYLCVWEGSLWPITIPFFNLCLHIFFTLYHPFKKIIITSIVRYRNQWLWDIKYSFAYIHTLNIYILEGCIKVIYHIVYILQVTTIINYISYCIFGNLAPSHNNTTISLHVYNISFSSLFPLTIILVPFLTSKSTSPRFVASVSGTLAYLSLLQRL